MALELGRYTIFCCQACRLVRSDRAGGGSAACNVAMNLAGLHTLMLVMHLD